MGEPIKKLGQIVSDIQDTLGQFNNISNSNISKNGNIDVKIENNINSDAKFDENDLIFRNEKSETYIKNGSNINEITEIDDNVASFSPKITESIFEKTDQNMSIMSIREKNRLNKIQIDINQSHSSISDESYNCHKNDDVNATVDASVNFVNTNDNEYIPKTLNYNLNNDISENKKHMEEFSNNMKLNIPDENTYLLMKDLIEKSKQKSEDISHLNDIINEYNNKNKMIEEENKNLKKINKVMQCKLDEINSNLLNMTSFENVSNLKDHDEAFLNSFSSSKQDNFITFINEMLEIFSTQLNTNYNNNNTSYMTKITMDKCLSSVKTNIKEYSEEKPYTLSRSVIMNVCNCFKDCQENINDLYTKNENLNDIKVDVNDINVLKEEYKKSLNTINQLELENNKNLIIINQLNSKINKENLSNYDTTDNSHIINTKYKDMTQRYNRLLIENENMKKNQIYLENLIEKWKLENNKLQKAIISFKNEFPVDKDLLQKNRILKNKLDDERLNIKKYTELIKALKTEIDQLKTENIHDNGKLTKQVSSELSSIKDIQSLYLESIKQITNRYNENEVSNSSNNVKIFNKQIEKLYEAVQESDRIKSHLAKLEQTIEDQVKEKEKVVVENKKIKKELNELQDKFKTHENIWLKKCRDLNADLNNTKNILTKTHNDYLKKEQEVIECQTIIDDYLLQYSKACDTCIAISSINKKSTQFLDNLHLKPGLSKQPFPFDEEIIHLCTWIKENDNDIKNLDSNTKELNKLLDIKNHEVDSLKHKSEELKTSLSNLQLLYDESKKKEKDYEEKLEQSIQKQNHIH
ncbi:hypothetical protein PIROE2DRAFT_11788 [Piromyces sp. E2]|nr:hypothetical protein PIROE2DRAFT_11788 [Piromyces sp. E2]|eukprot:OUM62027.1 hypothetical protein PIROE2DRAFT_11788 [Piromyces sp. E2]